MPKLAVVINTKNAAKTLEATLKSVQSIADEIVVVDMHSVDDTLKIAHKYKAKIYLHKNLNFADPARNFAVSKAESDWILVLDADEEIPKTLALKIKSTINSKQSNFAYSIARKNYILGKWLQHSGWWPDYQLRLFRKGEVSWTDQVHELAKAKSAISFFADKEELAIIHHNYQSTTDYLDRLNRYTSLEVKKRSYHDQLNTLKIIKIFFDEFLRKIFFYQGLKDGIHGVAMGLLQANYELVTLLKVYEQDLLTGNYNNIIDEKNTIKALRNFQNDLNYWIADYHVKQSGGIKNLYWQLRRKFKI